MYYLILYIWKRAKTSYWIPANAVHHGSISDWLIDGRLDDPDTEYLLINAIPITAEDYTLLDGLVD